MVHVSDIMLLYICQQRARHRHIGGRELQDIILLYMCGCFVLIYCYTCVEDSYHYTSINVSRPQTTARTTINVSSGGGAGYDATIIVGGSSAEGRMH